jgi:hypothetical protein
MYCEEEEEEDCASEENMETRFVFGDFQRHMEDRKEKMRKLKRKKL